MSAEEGTAAEAEALGGLAAFPLLEALHGRRARRFSLGAEIPDGPLAYASFRYEPMPLSDLEPRLVLDGDGRQYRLAFHDHPPRALRPPSFQLQRGWAGGRTSLGGRISHRRLFFTNDDGVYFFPTRDSGALVARDEDGTFDVQAMLSAHQGRSASWPMAVSPFHRLSPTWRGTTRGARTDREACWSFRSPISPSTCWPTLAFLCAERVRLSPMTCMARRCRGWSSVPPVRRRGTRHFR